MKSIRLLLSVLLLAGTLGWSTALAMPTESVLSKIAVNPESNYCHMKFPAIRENTLFTDHPVLKDKGTGDIIDFYGLCSHDPVGKDEVRRQRAELSYPRINPD